VLKGSTKNHGGTWYVILDINMEAYTRILQSSEKNPNSLKTTGAKYSVSIHSFSNLTMDARLDQGGLEPGATMNLRAVLKEYDVPLIQHAEVVAEVEYPDHSKSTLSLTETEQGVYEGALTVWMTGIYHFRILATGVNYKGVPFTREQI